MKKLRDLIARFHRDERGAFIALFGVLAVVLVATAGATVDFTSVQNARERAQVALDAAALAMQPEVYKGTYTTEQARVAAENLMLNRLGSSASNLDADTKPIKAHVTTAVVSTDKTTLTLTATLKVPLYFVALIGIKDMSMTLYSQTTRGSMDLEVAVALDITGSMLDNNKIGALKDAADDLVDILVLDQQTPTYSRVALVPYSNGVNVGSYANTVRGTPVGPKALTSAGVWQSGTNKTVSGSLTRANPARITTTAVHGFSNGDTVWISSLANGSSSSGWTTLNNRKYVITVTSTTRFTLDGINTNTASFSGTSTGGTIRKCLNPDCDIEITNTAHGLSAGEPIFFTNVTGLTSLNSTNSDITNEEPNYFTVQTVRDVNTFQLDIVGPTAAAMPSGGQFYCVRFGCQYYRFTGQTAPTDGDAYNLHAISTCVTERTIAPYKYTDAAPSTAVVGPNYNSSANTCPTAQIVPLTDSKTDLHNAITGLAAWGSTSGQIGTAWAWYMLSPNWASLWPLAKNRPAAYNGANLMKVVILMTDGSFNSVYCNGVISQDSLAGSWDTEHHINCNAQNGNPFQQTKDLCDAMKYQTGIIVYTVGFDIADQTSEKDMLSYCASDAGKFKLASDAAGLTAAFKSIAQDIAQLRLSE